MWLTRAGHATIWVSLRDLYLSANELDIYVWKLLINSYHIPGPLPSSRGSPRASNTFPNIKRGLWRLPSLMQKKMNLFVECQQQDNREDVYVTVVSKNMAV